jgi:wyosine [tRNA(Phe)-imidazoG37] synthetase (radical SAM superfamily)
MEDAQWPSRESVLSEIERTLTELNPPPAYITFSGNGEPTLHPDFDAIVDGVIDLRNRFSPDSKTAILSNSTTLTDERVRRAIQKLDVRILKLDAGNSEVYHNYNRPLCQTDLDGLIASLQSMKEVTIQALFAMGPSGNYGSKEVEDWVAKVIRISPINVQLYSLDRPFPSKSIVPVPREGLEEIKQRLEQYGIRAGVY